MAWPGDDTASRQLFAHVRVDGHVVTARLVGPNIGQREGPIVAQMIESELQSASGSIRHVVLDFSDVTYINSAGLGSCVTMRNQAKAEGAQVVLFGLRDDLRAVFKMTRMDKIFTIADDVKRLAKAVKK